MFASSKYSINSRLDVSNSVIDHGNNMIPHLPIENDTEDDVIPFIKSENVSTINNDRLLTMLG